MELGDWKGPYVWYGSIRFNLDKVREAVVFGVLSDLLAGIRNILFNLFDSEDKRQLV